MHAGDQSYKPELRFRHTPLTVKRKRHGQLLPAEAQAAAAMSDKVREGATALCLQHFC